MKDTIQLLQLLVCEDFESSRRDAYTASHVQSNLAISDFPFHFDKQCVVTCWRKDTRFHKEVIEYELQDGTTIRTPPMDIEPVTDSVLFRWHKHFFPAELVIPEPQILIIRVILDWKVLFETYLMIEQSSATE